MTKRRPKNYHRLRRRRREIKRRQAIRPWLADVLPDAFPDWRCDDVALELEMRDMYLPEPATFEQILATLADLENRINHAGG